MNDKVNTESLHFEQAQAKLEEIVSRMERGDQDLEASLTDFEAGVALMKHCQMLLKNAEQKVEILVRENEGLFTTEPFNAESESN